ncbi:helix-turn-helix transcriptional regulator [Deinococcus sp. QL22]|uniref:helix-turn-helix transcriptional regulator n=1 Tax=Deinococcus sp. QL22 TaxID=2939437 RepID=UPI002017573D|nr:helix-turn-helix transcriptional regulator [Deinococcus sp. QL22]UQN07986.1 helix-turn-helix transcriptional regulator [Deinococcus sp. QL22]
MEEVNTVSAELGEFLRSRRARLKPEDVGMPSYGSRRVPGLRREELAMVAGMSPTYYTRLEQGQPTQVSDEMLSRLSRALALSSAERQHLFNLARVPGTVTEGSLVPSVRSGIRHLLDAMPRVPAVLLNRQTDVLAWNRSGHALLAGNLPFEAPDEHDARPNVTRMLFLDEQTRALYARWDEEAARAVASLRLAYGRFSRDLKITMLVDELVTQSVEFAALWQSQTVENCISGTKSFCHPWVGPIELAFEALLLPDGSGDRLLTYTAQPNSAAEVAVHQLGSVVKGRG